METTLPAAEIPAVIVGKPFGIRAAAYILDTAIMYVVSITEGFGIGTVIGILYVLLTGRTPTGSNDQSQLVSNVAGLILGLLYFTLFEWLFGATPGKLILGMRVVREDGSPCGFGPALVRGLYRWIDGIIFGLVAYKQMKSPLNQRMGDKGAKTLVVGSKDTIILAPRSGWWFLVAAVAYLILDGLILAFFITREFL